MSFSNYYTIAYEKQALFLTNLNSDLYETFCEKI